MASVFSVRCVVACVMAFIVVSSASVLRKRQRRSFQGDFESVEDCTGNDKFLCEPFLCIQNSQVCNTIPDCPDGNDEENCVYSQDDRSFECDDGQFIPGWFVCDGFINCAGGEDEDQNCDEYVYYHITTPPQVIVDYGPTDLFLCADGISHIPRLFHCDDYVDCRDGSDEEGCYVTLDEDVYYHITTPPQVIVDHGPTDLFLCADGISSIPRLLQCDDYTDCHDGSDEDGCDQINSAKGLGTSEPPINIETSGTPQEASGGP